MHSTAPTLVTSIVFHEDTTGNTESEIFFDTSDSVYRVFGPVKAVDMKNVKHDDALRLPWDEHQHTSTKMVNSGTVCMYAGGVKHQQPAISSKGLRVEFVFSCVSSFFETSQMSTRPVYEFDYARARYHVGSSNTSSIVRAALVRTKSRWRECVKEEEIVVWERFSGEVSEKRLSVMEKQNASKMAGKRPR